MAIREIRTIKKFRAFTDWVPETPLAFTDINVVYGTNGSGKSTLASLLREAAMGAGPECTLHVDLTDHPSAAKTGDGHEIWGRVHVFNRGFVKDNLKFDRPEGTTAVPILRIGKAQVDAERRVAQLSKELEQLTADEAAADKKAKAAEKDADKLLIEAAVGVKRENRVLPPYANYTKANAKADLAKSDRASASTDLEADRATLAATTVSALTIPNRLQFASSAVATTAVELLAQSVSGSPIQDIKTTVDAHVWVEAGLTLHAERDTCLFCGEGVTPDRRAQLAAHFDDSLTDLNERLTALDLRAKNGKDAAKEALDILVAQKPSPGFVEDWNAAVAEAKEQCERLAEAVGAVRAMIAARRQNPFQVLAGSVEEFSATLDLTALVEVAKRHNAAAADHGEQRKAAADRIASLLLEDVADQHSSLTATQKEAEVLREALGEKVKAVKTELRGVQQSATTASISAEEMNRGFLALFGRTDLVFSSEDDGYHVLRDGEPAADLSEGERNGIALLYFLEALRSKDIKLEDAVVVIDDPISSMDAHIAAGISSYLWARLAAPGSNAKCHQLFVLTHDFEFFRSWIHQLNSRDSKQRPHRGNIYELRTGIAADGMVSAPVFYQWDEQDRTRRARSEYHYLFWRVARTLLDCRDPANSDAAYDAMFVLPNTCRRMLESFLSFRYPAQVGNFTSQMEAASKRIDDPDFGVRVTQFLHGSSHNEEPDTQRRSRRQEAVTMLSTVMRFMHAVDEEHFKEMCKASKITAFDLVPPA